MWYIFEQFSRRNLNQLSPDKDPVGFNTLKHTTELIEQKQFSKALERSLDVLNERQKNWILLQLTGFCYLFNSQTDDACDAFEESFQLYEDEYSAFYLAFTKEKLGEYRIAKLYYIKALAFDKPLPPRFELHFGLGRVYLALGRPQKAILELGKAMHYNPIEREPLHFLARAHCQAKDFETARKILKKLSLYYEESPEYLAVAADLARAEGQHHKAFELYQKTLKSKRRDLDALLGGAETALKVGKLIPANEFILRAQEISPNDERVHYFLGEMYTLVKNYDKAQTSYERSTALNPTYKPALFGQGKLLLKRSKPREAEARFQSILSTDPDYPGARRELARARLLQGDHVGALLNFMITGDKTYTAEVYANLGKKALQRKSDIDALAFLKEAMSINSKLDGLVESLNQVLQPTGTLYDFEGLQQTEIPDFEELKTACHGLCNFVLTQKHLLQFAGECWTLMERLYGPLRVGVFCQNPGNKKGLINELLGQEIIPEEERASSLISIWFDHSHRASVITPDPPTQSPLSELTEVLSRSHDTNEIHITLPANLLSGASILDASPLNEPDVADWGQFGAQVESCDLLVWVTRITTSISDIEALALERLTGTGKPVWVIINTFGELRCNDLAQLQESLDHFAAMEVQVAVVVDDDQVKSCAQTGLALIPRSKVNTVWLNEFAENSESYKLLGLIPGVRRMVGRIFKVGTKHFQETQENQYRLDRLVDSLEKIQVTFEDSFLDNSTRFLFHRIDFALTLFVRECKDVLNFEKFRGKPFIKDLDRDYLNRLIEEKFFKAIDSYQHRILSWIQKMFNDWFKELDLVAEQHPSGSQYFAIIFIERYLASQVHHFTTLDRWVIGNYKSYFKGWLDSGGNSTMREILLQDVNVSEESFKSKILEMIPSFEVYLIPTMQEWSKEFFASAYRFCDSLRKSLHLLAIEAEHSIVKPFGQKFQIND